MGLATAGLVADAERVLEGEAFGGAKAEVDGGTGEGVPAEKAGGVEDEEDGILTTGFGAVKDAAPVDSVETGWDPDLIALDAPSPAAEYPDSVAGDALEVASFKTAAEGLSVADDPDAAAALAAAAPGDGAVDATPLATSATPEVDTD